MMNPEILRIKEEETRGAGDALRSEADMHADPEHLFEARTAMLAGVERYIPVRLREKIRLRIAAERERLAGLLVRKTGPKSPRERVRYALDPAFFEQRPLEINIFE